MRLNTTIKRLRGTESQQIFATRMGISMSALQNYERETKPRSPTISLLVSLTKEARRQRKHSLANTFWKAFLEESGIAGNLNYFGFSEADQGLNSYLFWHASPESDEREHAALNLLVTVLAIKNSSADPQTRERALQALSSAADAIRNSGPIAEEAEQ